MTADGRQLGAGSGESPCITKTCKTGNITRAILMLKWRLEFFDAKLIMSSTVPDKPGEGLALAVQVLKFGRG
jgi:hypothetical protein